MNPARDVLLCYPKTGAEDYASPALPMSILALGSAIQKRGYTPILVDQRVHTDWKQRIEQWAQSGNALAAGISTMTGPQIAHALDMAKEVRAHALHVPCIWGGVHPTMLPEQTLAHPLCDIVVRREGEETLPALLDALAAGTDLSSISGIAYHNGIGQYIETAERPFIRMDDFVRLDYSLLDIKNYQQGSSLLAERKDSVSLYTSRGCPCRCSFCYNTVFHHAQWRGARAEAVVEMLKELHAGGIRNIHLADEYFFQDLERARQICRKIQDQKLTLTFSYANCRLDQVERMTEEDIKLFAKSGFKVLFVGVESGSPAIQKCIHKGIDPDALLPQLHRLNRQGIVAQLSFMLGLPGERLEDCRMTLRLMERVLAQAPLNIVPGAGKFLPFPGTEAFTLCVQSGWTAPSSLPEWAHILSTGQAQWLNSISEDVIAGLLFLSSALDTKINPRRHILMEILRKGYSGCARLRARRGWIRRVPEFMLMKTVLRRFLSRKRRG